MVDEKQRAAVRKYEEAHDRVTVMFDKGTRDRINRLGLNCTPAMFTRFAAEFMLNYCEKRSGNAL